MDGGSHWVRACLPPVAASVPAGRHLVRSWIDQLVADRVPDLTAELSDDLELAVTEVVTNALVHAGTAVEVFARLDDGTVRVEVADGSTHLPRRRSVGGAASAAVGTVTSGTGRGLRLLDEITRRWGFETRRSSAGGGKVVWFELGPASVDTLGLPDVPVDGRAGEPAVGDARPARPEERDHLEVVLLDVPLLLAVAWREHVSALIREHLLAVLDDADPEHQLTRHAAASQALALLEEHWAGPDQDLDIEDLLAASVEPVVTASRLVLRLPREAVEWFTVLEQVIEEALELADRGALLTAPTQPEMRAMRHWLVGEVTGQAAGDAPTPHVLGEHTDPPRSSLVWDPTVVDDAAEPLLAADDANRIVAASAEALAFLRADRSLVGRRLLSIIPRRYHQAHLAGFSLHLVNGRAPLIGSPVVVPVACGDGIEREAELLVKAERVDGRAVYIAEIRGRGGPSDTPPT